VLVVGNDKEFGKPLSTLGAVTPIDISIPEGTTPQPSAGAEGTAPAKPAQTDPQAKALLEKFVAFIGGADKVDAVKAIHQISSAEQDTPQGTISLDTDTYTVFPDQFHSIVRTAQLPAPMHIIVSSAGAWMSLEGQGTRDMPSSVKQDRLSSIRRGPLAVAQHAKDFTISMDEKVADGQTISITGDGVNVRWVLDPQSGRLLRSNFTASGQQGPVQRTIEFSDWRPAGGLNLPYKAVVQENGQQAGSEQIKSYEFNPKIDPKLFEKPEIAP
jgi:hypothetical protein